jgi:cysteine desulfurase/selenocysteine lyase
LLDIKKIREQFPILKEQVNGKPLIYFDNAATNQKPLSVINAITNYYSTMNANIHRGIHTLAETATSAFEDTRKSCQEFINAKITDEIIFTHGITDSINLVAASFGENLIEGDEVIISTMEHHSNIVPWQMACQKSGAVLKVVPISDEGEFLLDEYKKLLSHRTKMVAVTYASNTLGTINPIDEIIEEAHKVGAKVLIDAAQAGSHLFIDVQKQDMDFLAISSHKMYGPTGVGFLYGKLDLLNSMSPYQGGGEMIKEVSFEVTTYNDAPFRFEAGTPNIADVIAFKSAIDFVNELGKEAIQAYEISLLKYVTKKLEEIEGLRIIGKAKNKVGVASFVVEGVHHQDLAIMLDQKGIAVRTGHHCTQPLMKRFELLGTTRVSFAVYNTKEEVDLFIEALVKVLKMLR